MDLETYLNNMNLTKSLPSNVVHYVLLLKAEKNKLKEVEKSNMEETYKASLIEESENLIQFYVEQIKNSLH
jgi:UDP-N-acetylenolpyruvoylglucosamine reductase